MVYETSVLPPSTHHRHPHAQRLVVAASDLADRAAFVGWYQEKQAGDIVAQLKAGISLRAIVIRDGQEHDIEAREVVPGDIVVVEDGMTIPADGRVR